MRGQWKAVRGVLSAAVVFGLIALTGCGSTFFVCENKPSCPTSTTPGTTSNYAYVAYGTSGSTYINGYSLASSTLTATTNSPYSLGITPTAMAVSISNKFLYVASTNVNSSGTTILAGIYGFSIGTGGALSNISSGNALATQATVAALDVSPDGKWLIVATGIDGISQNTITAYAINATTGTLTAATPLAYAPPASSGVNSMHIAPSGAFIAMALGTGGTVVFPFNTSTGVISSPSTIAFASSAVGAFDVAIDSNNYLYIAATSNIYSFAVSSAGVPGSSAVSTAATASGGPFSIALSGTNYVYAAASSTTASTTTNLIYAFSNKNGVLTALSTPTIAAPASTTKLAVDSTKAYLLASGYDSTAGLRLYSISSAGLLSSVSTAGTGTTSGISSALALTH